MQYDRRSKRPADIEVRLADMTERGLSQYRMAYELGVSRITVRQWLQECGYALQTTYIRTPAGRC